MRFLNIIFHLGIAEFLPQTSDGDNGTSTIGSNVKFDLSPRIIGGDFVSISSIPFIVSLHIALPSGSEMCGGTIISPKYIITAAHCINGKAASTITVTAGSTKYGTGGETKSVRKIFTNEYDSKTIENDIAILELSSSLTNDRSSVQIGVGNPPSSAKCFTAGWGLTSNSGSASSTLKEVEIDLWPTASCRRVWGADINGDKQVCALGSHFSGDLYKDSCSGDSGGPLYCKDGDDIAFYGIVSYGPAECGSRGLPGVYTRVGYYRSSIESVTGKLIVSEMKSTPDADTYAKLSSLLFLICISFIIVI